MQLSDEESVVHSLTHGAENKGIRTAVRALRLSVEAEPAGGGGHCCDRPAQQ